MSDVKADFPILQREHDGKPLVYLDNAATTQKPNSVIEALADYYRNYNANVHRAAHRLAEEATGAMEAAREKIRAFINARESAEIVFTRGTTESINLIANCLSQRLQAGDEILISHLEHHSNIVPWQMIAERTGAKLVACDILPHGDIDLDDLQRRLNPRTRIVAIGHVSNALGTVHPVRRIGELAHDAGALFIVDGAQATGHLNVDVQALGCDAYAFSGHKMYGPTGIGVLYGRRELLDDLPPWQGGGEMIQTVSIESSTYNELPYKFEAGTPAIAEIIGLGAAIDYLAALDRSVMVQHEQRLLNWTLSQIRQIPGYRLVGEPFLRSGVISFRHEDAHPHDVATLLDQQGVCVRSGHHCAMPYMDYLGIPGTVRASFGLYNTQQDAQRLVDSLHKVATFL